jgi:POT family proton-dependent oligopeptide transporter
MASAQFATAPVSTDRMPPGIPFIVGNEGAERFSFYGMRAILVVFMTQHLMGSSGQLDVMSESEAKGWYHLFIATNYFIPLLGAIVSDLWLGKYRTILYLSLVYCAGHAALAADETRMGLALGLGLIALGAGGIKPCVSANVGDQFGPRNQHLLERVFGWFYFSINAGSFVSTLLTPWLLEKYGPSVAFGVPGVLMGIATLIFWLGRYRYAHIPPGGARAVREAFSLQGLKTVGPLIGIFAFTSVFWSLYDQTGSAWILQANHMDRNWLGIEWLSSQIHAVNPLLILVFIPLFTYAIYPAINKFFPLTPLRKISIGFFLTALSFAVSALIETWITRELQPNIVWQLLAYAIITGAEVMVSITSLEFAYTQAPKNLKSLVMSLNLLSVSAGNLITTAVNVVIQNQDGSSKLTGPQYYWFFAGLMFVTAVVFIGVAMRYQERRFIQDAA